tara:strand:+ start:12349 stop:12894 length:546 start_codon:yes stop_codon:yes gene_type:complete
MARENKSQYALLSFLSKRPMSGYDIKRLFEKVAPFYWSEANAQIYPILKRLEQEQYVESTIDEASGKRQKRIYHITKVGTEVLRAWLTKPIEMSKPRKEFLLKLNTGYVTGKDVCIQHVEEYQDEIQLRTKLLTSIIDHINTDHADTREQPYMLLTYDYSRRLLKMEAEWCEATLEKLHSM